MINASRSTTKRAGTAISTGFGDAPWSDPGNVTADDGAVAFWGAAGGGWESETLRVTNFNMGIPTNAVIEGVLVIVGDKFSFSQYTSEFTLRTNALTGTNKGGFNSLQDTYGGSTDLWGMALTPAIVNGSDFGVDISIGDISGGDAQASMDYIDITVYWRYDLTVAPAEVQTRHDYKIYSPSNLFMGMLPNVISEFQTQQDMNSAGCQLSIEAVADIDSVQPDLALGSLLQWLPGAWDYRQKIIINRAQVAADINDFPVYVDLASMDSRFWAGVKSDGSDIRITDQFGITELAFEVRNFNKTNKVGQLFFKANALYKSYDSNFWIYYGNASASAYAANATYGSEAVWSSYAGVYHLDENASTTAGGYDEVSTNNRNATGVSMGQAAITGKLAGQAADFDGVDDQLTVSSAFGLGNTNVTVQMWAYIDSFSENGAFIKIGSGANGFAVGVGGTTFENDGSQWILLFEAVRWITTGSYIPTTPGWYKVDMFINGSGVPGLYINGTLIGTFAGANAVAPTTSSTIGGYTNRWFGGKLDEIRISNSLRSQEWITTEYNNQNSPATFYSFGNEQSRAVEANNVLIKNGNLVNVYETSYYYPNGRLMYQGQINRVEAEFTGSPRSAVKMLCHSDGRDLDNLVARGAPFTYTNDQVQTSQNNFFTVSGLFPGFERCGQLWTVGGGVTNLGRIQLLLQGAADVTVNVYTDPTQATFLGGITKNVNVGAATVISFEFGDFLDTTAAADYFIDIRVGTGQTIKVYYTSTNPYAGGSMYTASYAGGSGGGSYGLSSGNDLYFTTAYGTPSTQATYTSDDPTNEMLPAIMTDYSNRGGLIKLRAGNYDASGLSLTASFNTNTIYEAIQKIKDMAPSGFYWYVDVGSNDLIFKRASATPDYLFYKGRHVENLSLAFSIENVINDILFSGGETAGVNLYRQYVDAASKSLYGTRLDRKSDNRVTQTATADAIGNSTIAELKNEQYQTGISIMARTMDIILLKPGKTIGFRGYGSFIDSLVLQITKVDYTSRRANLQVGTLPLRFNSAVEQTIRGLIAEQTVNNPSTPG